MIGIIFKTHIEVEEMGVDWEPELINCDELMQSLNKTLGYAPEEVEFAHERDGVLIYFTIDSLEKPRSITFSCTFGKSEEAIIRSIANDLGCRVFDSEMSDYI